MTLKKFKYIVEIEYNASSQEIANTRIANVLKNLERPLISKYRLIESKEID